MQHLQAAAVRHADHDLVRRDVGLADRVDERAQARDERLAALEAEALGGAEAHVEEYVQIDPNLFSQTADYLLRVKGQSMKDVGILDGDLLAVKNAKSANQGQIVVARIQDEVTVKRFFKNKNSIRLVAENPDFEDIIVNANEDFSIEGLAVGVIRRGGF